MTERTNPEWLRDLTSEGGAQAAAIADLRAVLVRASLYSFHRTQYSLSHLAEQDVQQLAQDCAQEALLSVLKHLPEFRGESKFTTWAFKFAVNLSLVRARRESWKHVSLDQLLADRELPELPFPAATPDTDPVRAAWRTEIWDTLREVIANELTARQRQVLIAMTFDEVPMDELTLRLNTNRNAIYKLLHDARRRLKARLEARGLTTEEIIDLFART
jgi:RNA polymerase sigma-70 factor (ECF subfamily)